MSLKNLALFVLTSALVLSGCDCGSSPPVDPGKPGVAKKLVFTVQPSKSAAGAALAPSVAVQVQDGEGKVVPGAKATVTLTLKDNPTGGTLSGAAPVEAAGGVATFSGLSVDKAGEGYTLLAHAEGLEDATSQAFTIESGAARRLAFAAEPGELVAGGTFNPLVRVSVTDALGNGVKAGTPVTLALGANPSGGTLSGTLTANAVDGVASFPELSLDRAGEGFTLVASAPGVDAVTSRAFRVKPGKAKALAFVAQPSTVVAGQPFSPSVQVRLVDVHGNTATDATDSITVALGGNGSGATLGGTLTVAAVDGVATFPDLSMDRVGTGYTLTASGEKLDGATSEAFDVTAGAAMRLAFRVQPSQATAGAPFTAEVVALDTLGNLATAFSGAVNIILETNPTGDSLRGLVSVNAVGGVARFDGAFLTQAGAGYSLQAFTAGIPGAFSASFDVTAGAASRLAFAVEPSNAGAGSPLSPPVQVRVEDAFGNLATSSTASISLVLAGSTPGALPVGTTRVSAVGGVATFDNLAVNRKGLGYTLIASANGFADVHSRPFDILHGAPTKLAFLAQPGSAVAGEALAPAVKVVIQDANGDTATTANLAVTVKLGANAAGGTLSGTHTVTAVAGVATFSELSLDKVGTGYTLEASAVSVASATSSAFDVTPGAAARLSFRMQPSQAAAGVALSPAIEVSVLDAVGNLTASTASITLALGNNPGDATLSGTATVSAVAGVASFPGLSLDKAGTGYTLTASASGLSGSTSAAFDIRAAVPSRLAFHVQPSNAPAGEALSPAVVVRIEDAFGNRTDSTASIAVALGDNASGATLSGTLAVAAVAGEATFSTLSVDKLGQGYTLTASAPGLASATSSAFAISANTATQLAFTVQPSDAKAGASLAPSVEVTLRDALGNRTDSTASVTLLLGNNPAGATLSGTATVNAVNGKATFPGLSLDKVGAGYTLVASSAGVPPATSAAFDVTAGAAERLAFRVQPSTVGAGAAFSPSVEVSVLDAFDNLTASTASVTLALGENPAGGTLSGTRTVSAVAGIATFAGVTLDKRGTGYTLVASASGLASATSGAFEVVPGAAARLAFSVQPSNATAGAALAPAVQVVVRDAFGNAVTSTTHTVTVELGAHASGATLGGTRTVDSSSGVASFSALTVQKAGTGYTLVASAAGLTSATSSAFDVAAGAAERLAFRVQPSNGVAGENLAPAVEVAVEDGFGNAVASSTASVTVALGAAPSGATLFGTQQQGAVQGVARFDALSLPMAGTGYTLVASSPGLTSATSGTFNVTAAAASALAFTVQPSNVVSAASISPAVQVAVRDAFGNTVTSSTAPITLAVANNPSSGTLSGTLTVSAAGGVATFPGLSVDKAGAGYTLTASSGGLTSSTSTAFNVTAGPASRLAFSVQPTNVAAGSSITPAVAVSVVDAGGNTVASTASITIALGNNPGVGILNGTRTVSAVGGTATFPGLSITRTGEGYTLRATATNLTAGTSAGFNVTPGAATSLAFYTNAPNVVTAGVAITPSVKVGVRDSFGNTVTGSTASITLSLSTNPGGSTLGGTLTVAAVDGVATFPDLTLNKAANNYRFAATSTGLTNTTSALFNVSAGAATQLAFTTQPANVPVGASFGTAVRVTVRDAFDNTVLTPALSVSMAIGNNPGGSTLGGTTPVTTVSGVATFSNLTFNKVGTGYTLVASATGLPAATSAAFNVTAGAASQLAFTVQPSSTTAGTTIAPAMQVSVLDAGGNLVTSATTTITLGLGANPGGGALSGPLTVSASGGVATFPSVSLAKAGAGYTLVATAVGLSSSTSTPFDVTAAPASQLAFTVQPSRANSGQPLSPAVRVAVQDAFGNVSTDSNLTVTLVLGTNPSGATLSGATSVAVASGVATFSNLLVDRVGTGYTLVASAGALTGATSVAFDVVAPGGRLVYLDPMPNGKLALVRNPASTDTAVVLDLMALEDVHGYSVGMNLPLDASLVQAGATLMTPGMALPAGTAPTAAYGKLPTSGPLAGVLTTGQSQKAAGPGAVLDDSPIPSGSVLYTVRLELKPGATTGLVFDGAALGPKFRGLLRDKFGTDVVGANEFAIGRLEVQ